MTATSWWRGRCKHLGSFGVQLCATPRPQENTPRLARGRHTWPRAVCPRPGPERLTRTWEQEGSRAGRAAKLGVHLPVPMYDLSFQATEFAKSYLEKANQHITPFLPQFPMPGLCMENTVSRCFINFTGIY